MFQKKSNPDKSHFALKGQNRRGIKLRVSLMALFFCLFLSLLISPGFSAQSDLLVEDIKFYSPRSQERPTDEVTPQAGQLVTCKAILKNIGDANTSVFNVKWFVDGTQVGYGSHSGLGAGTTSNGNVRFDWIPTVGTHTLRFVADADNFIPEPNKANNSLEKTLSIPTPAQPDLFVEDIKFYSPRSQERPQDEVTPIAGQLVTCKAILKNIGEAGTSVFNVKWFLDGAQVGYGSHSGLANDATSNGNVRFDWTPTSGNHSLRFVADSDSFIPESNEANNAFEKNLAIAENIPPTGSLSINNNNPYANSPSVNLTLSAQDNPGGSGLSQMQFSDDNSTWSTPEAYATTKSWVLTLSDGQKTVYVKFSDKAGNLSLVYSDTIILDSTPPVTIVSGIDGQWRNSPVTVTLNATDSLSGVDKTYYSTDGSSPNIAYNGPFALSNAGTYTIKYYSQDKAGNSEAIGTANNQVKIDLDAPTGVIKINEDSQYTNSSVVTLSLLAADSASGVSQMQFSNDNTNWSGPEGYSVSKTWTLASGDGAKTVYVKFMDIAGNWSQVYSDSIVLDTSPASAPIVTDDGTATSSTTQLYASWSASDSESGITEYRYKITQDSSSGPDIVDWTSIATATRVTKTGLSLIINKTYYFSVQAKNGSGLWSDTGTSDGIKVEPVDTTPPTGSIKINDDSPETNSTSVALSLSAADSESGMDQGAQMQFSNDDTTWSTPEPYAITKDWALIDGEGEKTVYVRFKDVAGNWSQSFSDTIILKAPLPDTTAPVTADSGIDSLWHNNPVTVTLNALDLAVPLEPDIYTKLLLRADGIDGSTNFSDSMGYAVVTNGNAQIDTAQSKFGSASALFDGDGDYLTVADSEDWNFGSGDFTIEGWIKQNSGGATQSFVGKATAGGVEDFSFRLDGGGTLRGTYVDSAAVNYYALAGQITDSNWHHVALVRSGGSLIAYLDGVGGSPIDVGATTIQNSAAWLSIGRPGSYDGQYFNGWIDEFRISKGIARWTSNFTPPSDFGSGVSKTYYSTDGSSPNILYANPFTLSDEGIYTIKYYSIDNAGNIEAVKTASNPVKIDTTPPTGTCAINNGDATTEASDVTLNLTAADSASGMEQGAQTQFSNDNTNWSNPQDYAASMSWTLASGFGMRTAYARFKDAAGNWSESVSDTIEVLNVPKERIFIYLNGQRVAMEENNKKFFFHNDHLGGTNVVTDESGAQVEYVEYEPFGSVKQDVGRKNIAKKFTGKELDSSTGLYDYSARQYDAKLGRFISADTVDPDWSNPQSLNRYSYVLNNPLKYIDPTGHEPISAAVIAYLYAVVSSPDFQYDLQQLQLDAMAGDVGGMAIDVVSAAVPGLSATVAKAGRKAVSGAIEAIGKTKVGKAGETLSKLPGKIADTFRGGKYKNVILEGDMKVYRVFGGESTLEGASEGIFLSAHEYKTSKNAQKFLALPKGNAADQISEVIIPKGTEINVGKTRSLFEQSGGGTQIYVKDKQKLIFKKPERLK